MSVYPIVSFNSIQLNDGVNTWILSGASLGERQRIYDEVRSYDGTLVLRDVHDTLVDMVLPMRMMYATGAELSTALGGLRAACIAGGTMTWQDAVGGSVLSWTIAPSAEPQIPRTLAFEMRNRAQFTLDLKRWP